MSETLTITLASKSYTIRRLTLKQSRAVGIGVMKIGSEEDAFAGSIDQAVAVLAAVFARDYPEMTEQALWDGEFPFREVRDAADAVLEFSGFVKGAASGEAAPEVASTGQT